MGPWVEQSRFAEKNNVNPTTNYINVNQKYTKSPIILKWYPRFRRRLVIFLAKKECTRSHEIIIVKLSREVYSVPPKNSG